MAITDEQRKQLDVALKILGLPDPLPKLINAFLEVLDPNSDRARVLVATAMIDNGLESLLRWHFMKTDGVKKKDCDFLLKNGLSPLRSLFVRTQAAFALGLIGRDTRKGIDFVRDIRNECAHNETPPKITEDMGKELFQFLNPKIRETMEQLMRQTQTLLSNHPQSRFLVGCLGLWSLVVEPMHQKLIADPVAFGEKIAELNTHLQGEKK